MLENTLTIYLRCKPSESARLTQTELYDGWRGGWGGCRLRCSCWWPALRHGGGVVVLEHEARLDDLLRLHARHLHRRPVQLVDDGLRSARQLRPLQDRQIRHIQGEELLPARGHAGTTLFLLLVLVVVVLLLLVLHNVITVVF